MVQTDKQLLGQKGESEAVKWLKNRGFVILDCNYLTKWGEIDIVAKKGQDLVFVEVKTVTRPSALANTIAFQAKSVAHETTTLKDWTSDAYEPEDNIHPWKLKRLARTIEIYLSDKNIDEDIDWRLDALSVYFDQEGRLVLIECLEDIF
jgi:putative endonuclease